MPGFYIKWKMRGREQDSGEAERERVLETEHCWKRDNIGNKIDH